MNLNQFTVKSQEVIQKAQELAFEAKNPSIETGHILSGLFLVDENVLTYALKKINANQGAPA